MTSPLLLASHVLLWLIVLLQAVVIVVLVRHVGLLHLRLGAQGALATSEGPTVGDEAPLFETVDVTGRHVTSPWQRDKRSLLIFVSPNCGACTDLVPSIRAIRRAEPEMTEILLFSDVGTSENLALAGRTGCPVIVDGAIAADYGVEGSPYAIAIDTSGKVRAKGVVNHVEHLESLLDFLAADLDDLARDSTSSSDQSSRSPEVVEGVMSP